MIHIMFCCNRFCLKQEMGKFIAKHPEAIANFSTSVGLITNKKDRIYFIAGKKIEIYRAQGIKFNSWSSCGEVEHTQEDIDYLQAAKRPIKG